MCGRYTLSTPGELVASLCDLADVPDLPPRYNIAPTQPAAVVRVETGADRAGPRRSLRLLRWGMVPATAAGVPRGRPLINARAESAAARPAFCESLNRRRCLVPADGFYEWRRDGTARAAGRQAYRIRLAGGGPFVMAGLWDRCQAPDGAVLESFAILTTAANALVAPIHDRMPVILPAAAADRWLDPAERRGQRMVPLLVPFPPWELALDRVGPWVNRVAEDSPRCAEPAERASGPV